MRRYLHVCDLCASQGTVRLATAIYQAGHRRWATCPTHLQQLDKNEFPVVQRFDLPGDADPQDFVE